LQELLHVPVAHGEGRFVVETDEALAQLKAHGHVALTYVDSHGQATGYPGNPNGSVDGIAGICNARGNVFGLMPHPEDHIMPYQHPRWTRGESGRPGLPIFQAGIRYVSGL
jgi:phosphoribosylformylglycinamidine synthase